MLLLYILFPLLYSTHENCHTHTHCVPVFTVKQTMCNRTMVVPHASTWTRTFVSTSQETLFLPVTLDVSSLNSAETTLDTASPSPSPDPTLPVFLGLLALDPTTSTSSQLANHTMTLNNSTSSLSC